MKPISHLSKEEYKSWEAPSEEEMMEMRDKFFAENGKWYYQAVWETSPHWNKWI
jgi:hypothetical protein